jgi:uncharacterized membrane protein
VTKIQRRLVIATMAFSTVINFYHIFFAIFQCGNPIHYAENQVLGKCVSARVVTALGYEQAVVSTLADVIFAAMPIPLLWNAKMDLRSKISAGFILSLGALYVSLHPLCSQWLTRPSGSICSIVRFLYIENLGFDADFFCKFDTGALLVRCKSLIPLHQGRQQISPSGLK